MIDVNLSHKIGVIGLGNLGTAIAHLIANNGFDVVAWEHDPKVVDEVNSKRQNSSFLAGIQLPDNIIATGELNLLFEQVVFVFITLPSRFIKPVLQTFSTKIPASLSLISLAKGIDSDSGLTAYEIIDELFPGNPKAVVSGPSLANEFVRGQYTAVMAASKNKTLLRQIREVMSNEYFKVAFCDDIRGVELGGILKNIYALGYGVLLAEAGPSLNFSGLYFSLAIKEMTRLGVALGAKNQTLIELSGLGDLLCTALSPDSHNRKLGTLLAQGLSIEQAEIEMGLLPESYNTLQTLLVIAQQKNLAMPIAQALMKCLQGAESIGDFQKKIMQIVQD